MNFQLEYNVLFELSILPVDVILVLFVMSTYNNDDEKNYRFKIFSSFVTVSTMFNITNAIVMSMHTSVPLWFHKSFNSFNLVLSISCSMTFFYYAVVFVGALKHKKILYIYSYVVGVLFLILLAVNLFTGIIFSYDSNYTMVKTPLWGVMAFMVPLSFVVISVFIFIFMKRKLSSAQIFYLSLGLLTLIVVFSIQMLLYENMLISYYIVSVGMFMVFLTLETPDYSKLLRTLAELDETREREKKALEKLKTSDENKSKILTYLSHELKTPINAILGYNEEIMYSDAPAHIKESASNAFKGAKRLNQFFSDIVNELADIEGFGDASLASFGDYDDNVKTSSGTSADVRDSGRKNVPAGDSNNLTVSNRRNNGKAFIRDSSDYRILCVDDNEMNMDLLVRTINSFGFTTETAVDGKQAVDMVRKNTYDLILMDHMMPVMDGIEALHVIRDENLCNLTPVIVVTANSVKGERDKYLSEGFDSYIPKPFTGGSLLRAIGKFLPIATMETLVKTNSKVGISRIMLASTFSRPLIAPGARILVAGTDRFVVDRFARRLSTTMAWVDVSYNGDDCIRNLSENEYDILFVEDDLKYSENRLVKAFIWNCVDASSIVLVKSGIQSDPSILYDSYTDYIDNNADPDIIDAMLLLYLSKNKVSVIGSDKNDDVYKPSESKTEDEAEVTYSFPKKAVKEEPEELSISEPDEEEAELPKIDCIDVNMGVENCGSVDGLLRAIEIFVSTSDSKIAEIEELYRTDDVEGYTIRVHALKSSARIIGAMEVSELARQLEEAGKNKDKLFIESKNLELIEKYRKLSDDLKSGSKKEEKAKKLPPEGLLYDAYSSIYELAGMMDYDSIEMIFDTLREYSFEDEDQERIDRIKKAMDDLNWENVQKFAKEAL